MAIDKKMFVLYLLELVIKIQDERNNKSLIWLIGYYQLRIYVLKIYSVTICRCQEILYLWRKHIRKLKTGLFQISKTSFNYWLNGHGHTLFQVCTFNYFSHLPDTLSFNSYDNHPTSYSYYLKFLLSLNWLTFPARINICF